MNPEPLSWIGVPFGLAVGYFILPWLLHGVTPAKSWRMLRRHWR
jgi:hypothetical protein